MPDLAEGDVEEIVDFFVAQLRELESREPDTREKVQALYDSGNY